MRPVKCTANAARCGRHPGFGLTRDGRTDLKLLLECSDSGVELRLLTMRKGSFFTLHCSSSLSCMNEYLATDIRLVDMCTSSLRALIAAWLGASQRR